MTLDGLRLSRFRSVTSAHRFLLRVRTASDAESLKELDRFLESIAAESMPRIEVETILQRCAERLGALTHATFPFTCNILARSELTDDLLRAFEVDASAALRHRRPLDRRLADAIRLIESRYSDSTLRVDDIPAAMGIARQSLRRLFKSVLGHSIQQEISDVRLTKAAAHLAGTSRSVKEVWSSCGFNDGSNFSHEFRKRYAMTPGEYRAVQGQREHDIALNKVRVARPSSTPGPVLVVDDDEGTRESYFRYLTNEGYRVALARTGEDGLTSYRRLRPCAVLLDYHLEDMTAAEWMVRERTVEVGQVIVFTADFDADLAPFTERRIRVLSKLADIEEVVKAIDQITGRVSKAAL